MSFGSFFKWGFEPIASMEDLESRSLFWLGVKKGTNTANQQPRTWLT